MNIGNAIRHVRKNIEGMTLQKLSTLVGVSPEYLSRLETGERENPSVEVVTSIAESLGVLPVVIYLYAVEEEDLTGHFTTWKKWETARDILLSTLKTKKIKP